MSGLKFYTSNRLEDLAERLAGALDLPGGPALAPEIVVVQSRGMARWLSLRIAQLRGVSMGFEFPFPRAFVDRTLRLFFPGMGEAVEFSTGVMAWKIHALLPSLVRKREMTAVRDYLEGDEGLKAFQLSEKIAGLFDQYLVYRPDMILRWEREGAGREWQAAVWRELIGRNRAMHIAAVSELLDERMAKIPGGITGLPGRVSLFGVSSLPPLYLRVLLGLARHCEVNFFSLQPSMEYIGHDLSSKARARIESKSPGVVLETGNMLLASLGKLNRDFTEERIELDERAGFVVEEQPGRFVEPSGGGMLEVIQGDILHARNRGDAENPKVKVEPGDRTIQVHACHSPMREIEVLYDHLLDFFQQDHTLRPQDIIVMAPDIEKYAPFIQAVFATPETGARFIPFSVADRVARNQSPMVSTFLALLGLPGSRCTATEIFSMLDRMPLRARFKFTDADMETIREWIAETGIRWGIDGAHRGEFSLPKIETATWRAGFQRLLLGYAMAGDNRTMFEGVMPFDDIEGGNVDLAGRFISASEALFELVSELPGERPLPDWPDMLGAIASRFFSAETPEEAADLRFIQGAIDQLREVAQRAGSGMAGFRAVRHFLARLLDDTEQRGGFFTGGVTFCALKPMRSIPARVICLIGMDDAAFPRRATVPTFDLMAREGRCGDRSPRDDDRFSFLEAIISARERLYIGHLGRSITDNTEIPPSVLVSELLDCMDRTFEFPGGQDAHAFATAEHRLHAFSSHYFDGGDPRLFSYSEANAAASRSQRAVGKADARISFPPVGEPAPEMRNVELRSLIEFFTHPAKYFVRRRLGIVLDEEDDSLEDNEIFEFEGLQEYLLRQELVADAVGKHERGVEEFASRSLLPLGAAGEARFVSLKERVADFSRQVESELGGAVPAEPIIVDLRIGEFSLTGSVDSIYGNRIVLFRHAQLKAKDWLRTWINHLAKCASSPGAAETTVLIGEEEMVRFTPVDDAAGLLASLLEIYWRGLRESQHFFPASSYAYADAEIHPSTRRKHTPLEVARQKWDGGEWSSSSEKYDAYNTFCFPEIDPIDADFTKLAMEVFAPMIRHATES